MFSTVTTKGRVTIPKSLRDALGIRPKDRINFAREGERIVIQPLKSLKNFRGTVKAPRPADFATERAAAKTAVARRNNSGGGMKSCSSSSIFFSRYLTDDSPKKAGHVKTPSAETLPTCR